MSSYGGAEIFGLAVQWSTTNNPRELQLNSFFGVDGLESLDGGSRGRTTLVAGVLRAPDSASLASIENNFRSLQDGAARTLVDGSGTTWEEVILENFQPQGRVRRAADGVAFRPYRARFLHLV